MKDAELSVELKGTAELNECVKSLIKQIVITPLRLDKRLIRADFDLIKINKIQFSSGFRLFAFGKMIATLHILKYMCICMRINTLLLVSLCNEQILALVLEERSPLK